MRKPSDISTINSHDDCKNCGHSYALHTQHNGYQPYGHCNYGHDLCSCNNYETTGAPTRHQIVMDMGWKHAVGGNYTCPDCKGIVTWEDINDHVEWHKTLIAAIREQIEEEIENRPRREQEKQLENCRNGTHMWKEGDSTGYGDNSVGTKSCTVCNEKVEWSTFKIYQPPYSNTVNNVVRKGTY